MLVGPEEGQVFTLRGDVLRIPLRPDHKGSSEWQPLRIREYRWRRFATPDGRFSRAGWVLEGEFHL